MHSTLYKVLCERFDLKYFPNPGHLEEFDGKADCNGQRLFFGKEVGQFSKADSRKHIDPQKNDADLVIEYFPVEPISSAKYFKFNPLCSVYVCWDRFEEFVERLHCSLEDLVESSSTINTNTVQLRWASDWIRETECHANV